MANVLKDELRAQVISKLLTGANINEAAKEAGVSYAAAKAIHDRLMPILSEIEPKQPLGELVAGYLEESLKTLREQVKLFGDMDWMRKQDPFALATIHEVLATKTLRLMEAAEAVGVDESIVNAA